MNLTGAIVAKTIAGIRVRKLNELNRPVHVSVTIANPIIEQSILPIKTEAEIAYIIFTLFIALECGCVTWYLTTELRFSFKSIIQQFYRGPLETHPRTVLIGDLSAGGGAMIIDRVSG